MISLFADPERVIINTDVWPLPPGIDGPEGLILGMAITEGGPLNAIVCLGDGTIHCVPAKGVTLPYRYDVTNDKWSNATVAPPETEDD